MSRFDRNSWASFEIDVSPLSVLEWVDDPPREDETVVAEVLLRGLAETSPEELEMFTSMVTARFVVSLHGVVVVHCC